LNSPKPFCPFGGFDSTTIGEHISFLKGAREHSGIGEFWDIGVNFGGNFFLKILIFFGPYEEKISSCNGDWASG